MATEPEVHWRGAEDGARYRPFAVPGLHTHVGDDSTTFELAECEPWGAGIEAHVAACARLRRVDGVQIMSLDIQPSEGRPTRVVAWLAFRRNLVRVAG